ncbi:MAG: C_GCAxxG_C_C family protein [Candidatus Heimdallarchaeota archaeon]|nr:C_GCAxxG_C_C family protein [Candidatus Heimdallarchaeota archaeon]
MSIDSIILEIWADHNCARATGVGLLRIHQDPDADKFFSVFTSFGGGMGERGLCGAMTGTVGAMSKLLSEKQVNEEQIRDEVNRLKEHMRMKFGEGSIDCKAFLKDYLLDDGSIDSTNSGRRDHCTSIVLEATRFAHEIINQY